jgi:hypothetical protein
MLGVDVVPIIGGALAIALSGAVLAAAAASSPTLTPFSSAAPGAPLPQPWRIETLEKIPRHTRYDLVERDGTTVLRARADASYANLLHPLDDAPAQRLRWRWRVEEPVQDADLTRKAGDDVPARVCVLFDLPLDHLGFGDRLKVQLGRRLYDRPLPAASICYVWDRRLAPGTWLPNAYTDRVRMLVLRQGDYGNWFSETRDLAADFRRAFPDEARSGVPPLSAVGVSADADDTGDQSLAYFGDLELEAH